MTGSPLNGMLPAIPTFFSEGRKIDEAAMRSLVEYLIADRANAIVAVGGTGEYTAMSPAQRIEALEICVDAVAGRVPVVAGILSPGIGEAVQAARDFVATGASHLLVIAPFYVRPTQDGIRRFMSEVRSSVDADLLFYDIPGRTGTVTDPETIHDLSWSKVITGMKACNTDLAHFQAIAAGVDADFALLSGDDYLYPEHLELGAVGGILASSVLLPGAWADLHESYSRDGIDGVRRMHAALMPLLETLFSEANPGPLKAALAYAGFGNGEMLPPLVPPGPELAARLRELIDARLN